MEERTSRGRGVHKKRNQRKREENTHTHKKGRKKKHSNRTESPRKAPPRKCPSLMSIGKPEKQPHPTTVATTKPDFWMEFRLDQMHQRETPNCQQTILSSPETSTLHQKKRSNKAGITQAFPATPKRLSKGNEHFHNGETNDHGILRNSYTSHTSPWKILLGRCFCNMSLVLSLFLKGIELSK